MIILVNILAKFLLIECRVTAVDGHYQIGIYTVREIQHGEEITFDYNSVTEVCLFSLICVPLKNGVVSYIHLPFVCIGWSSLVYNH